MKSDDSNTASSSTNRRRFLEMVAKGGAVAGGACLGVACSSTTLSGTYAEGNVSALAVGDLIIGPDGPIAIGRDSGGVYAMTLICTHEQCDMAGDGTVSSTGVTCNCHGSAFDVNGNVTRGPASSPLQHFQVTISSAGEISVDASVPVAETVRTPVAG